MSLFLIKVLKGNDDKISENNDFDSSDDSSCSSDGMFVKLIPTDKPSDLELIMFIETLKFLFYKINDYISVSKYFTYCIRYIILY